MTEESSLPALVLRRFLPACAGVLLGVLTVSAISNPGGLSSEALRVAGIEVGLMTIGFAATLGLLRKVVPERTRLGRRSFIAGLATPLALGMLSIFTQGASLSSIAVLSLSAGVVSGVVAVGTAFIRRRAQLPLDPEVQAALEQLDQELGLGVPQAHIADALPRHQREDGHLRR